MKNLDIFVSDIEPLIAARFTEEEKIIFNEGLNRLRSAVSHLESNYNLSIQDRATAHTLLRKTSQDLIERYQILFEYSGTAMAVVEPDGSISLINSFFEKMFGCRAEDVVFKQNFFDYIADDKRVMMFEYHSRRKEGNLSAPHYYESRMRGCNGWILDVMVSIGFFPKTRQSIASIVDITERKHAEEALHQANKKLNILSSITRHDIVNEIQVILLLMDILKEQLKDPSPSQTVSQISEAVNNVRSLINFTKFYQDIGVRSAQWQDISNTILQASGSMNIEPIKIIIETKGLEVFADPLLNKVFYNLIENAVRYGKKLTQIRFYYQESDENLSIYCEDDGVGIPEKEKKNIFQRKFFQHTGFGLFLSREILTITGLSIRETGEEGKGARFEILVGKGKYRNQNNDLPVST